MRKNFFYKTGLDVTNDKQMFEFLKNHFMYDTMNSWNGSRSIANNVKVYKLALDGDCWQALSLLSKDEYYAVNMMIEDWEYEHKGYRVGFNGRSGGYLVLYNGNNTCNILPDLIVDNDYNEFKDYCKEYYRGVKHYRPLLKEYVKLVRDFDKLCDDIREYVNELSTTNFALDSLFEVVEMFNDCYREDLNYLKFSELKVESGKVYIGEIKKLKCLYEVFERLADYKDYDLNLVVEDNYVYFEQN
jgi:hypothetical protein